MRRARPLIGVTGPAPGRGDFQWFCVALALWRAGARPLRLWADNPGFEQPLRGLVLGGGDDIEPRHYGGEDHHLTRYDPPRDAMEMGWFAQAEAQGLPVLGICRGLQMINICRGGSLYADVKLVFEEARYPVTAWGKVFYRKPVAVCAGTGLARLMRRKYVWVNSLHHQCVDRLGEGLVLGAKERNGIVQAIEAGEGAMRLGVQWHPEFMPFSWRQRRVFQELVRKAR